MSFPDAFRELVMIGGERYLIVERGSYGFFAKIYLSGSVGRNMRISEY